MSDWISVKDRLPPKDKYVLAAAPSGYIGIDWRYTEAKHNPDYKGWVNCANDRITDSGEDVAYWMPLPEPPGKRRERYERLD